MGASRGGDRPILCLVVDRRATRGSLPEVVGAAAVGGVDWLQLRERELEGAAWLAWAGELIAAGRQASPALRVIVNRRLDIALALGADGVQLGFDALTPRQARELLGPRASIGVSTHGPEEIAGAARAGADYVQLAPIFDPRSKPATRAALGIEALARGCRHGVPVLAQGGIDAARCAEVVAAGAAGVAVTGDVLMSDDPGGAAAALRAALDRAAR